MFCLDTRGLCFLCYKLCEDSLSSANFRSADGDDSFDSGRASDNDYQESPKSFSSSGNETNKIDDEIAKQTNLFCKILFRILGFDPLDQHATSEKKRRIDKLDMQLQICTDCLRIANNVCEICHQISSLQLLLNWKLMRIRDTMRSADKAPSRSSAFKNVFKCTEKSSQSESPMNDSGPQEEFKEIQSLRKDIIRKCSERLQNARPKVFLHRLTKDSCARHEKENKNPELIQDGESESSEISHHKNLKDCSEFNSNRKREADNYQPETSVCPSLSTHLTERATASANHEEGEHVCCNELNRVDDDTTKSSPERSESKLFPDMVEMELPVEVETKTNAIHRLHESVEQQPIALEEEDEPPPVPIEINTKLVQIKESDNDKDFHPSDVEADDMSSDEYGKLDLTFQTEKNEGRKRKRKAKVKCTISDVKHGRPKFSTVPNVKKKPKTKLT